MQRGDCAVGTLVRYTPSESAREHYKVVTMPLHKIVRYLRQIGEINKKLGFIQESLGRIELRQVQSSKTGCLLDAEYKIFSQWREDGIIQYLVNSVPITNRIFVEFGVENYTESNTRFLVVNNNWQGLVMDGSKENIDYIKKDKIYWAHSIKAVHAFITRENINELLKSNGIEGEIGLLSIDIDGNDYWVWDAIDVIEPSVVVVEYNHRFGKERAVTVPYQQDFVRFAAHSSMIYYGASLKALYLLGKKKGYSFVGCNSAGNNAFFVKTAVMPANIREVSVEEGFVQGMFRESHNKEGKLIFLSIEEELDILKKLPVVELDGQ
jgi:hypothetical protein